MNFRDLKESEIDVYISMLKDDMHGKYRQNESDNYQKMFKIFNNSDFFFIKVLSLGNEILAACELVITPSFTFSGSFRLNVEGVRVKSGHRGEQIGELLFAEIEKFAQANKCHILQLACNNERDEAQKFYQKLSFQPTHTGFKKYLNVSNN